MLEVKEQYVVNKKGEEIAVMIDLKNYQKLLKYIENIEDALELKKAVKEEKEKGITLKKFTQRMRKEGKL